MAWIRELTVQQPKSTFILLVSPRKIVPRDPCRDSMLCVSPNSEKIVPKIASQPAQWFNKNKSTFEAALCSAVTELLDGNLRRPGRA